jgi:hypothetical protein
MLYLSVAQLRTLSEIVPGGVIIDASYVYDDGVRAIPADTDDIVRSNVAAVHVSPAGEVTILRNVGAPLVYSKDDVREMTRARILGTED